MLLLLLWCVLAWLQARKCLCEEQKTKICRSIVSLGACLWLFLLAGDVQQLSDQAVCVVLCSQDNRQCECV